MRKKLLLTVIISTSSIISIPVFAGLDTIIQTAGETLRPKDNFDNLQNSINIGNIYSNAYDLAQKELSLTTSQAVIDMTKELNTNYNCSLEINDTTNILLTIDGVRNDLAALVASVHQPLDGVTSDDFMASCTKLINCATNKNGNIKTKDIITNGGTDTKSYLTENGFLTCRSLATKAYKNNASTIGINTTLASTNAGSDTFYNGTLDDSPYDILIDIQHIGDVLFTTNEQSEKVLFYTFPNNSIAGIQAIPFDSSSKYTSLPNATIIQKDGTVRGATSLPNQYTNSSGTVQGSSSIPSSNSTNSGTSNTNNGYNAIIPVYVNGSTQNSVIPIDNFSCTPLLSTDSNSQTSESGGSSQTASSPQEEIGGVGSTPYYTSPYLSGYTPPIMSSNTPYYSPIVTGGDDPINSNANRSDPANFEQMAATISTCTQKCEGLKAIDKAMCIAKCTCGTTYTKNGLFGLSVCTVPSKQTDIVSSKPVQSIEEIIYEINNVLATLKGGGELMKHTRTKEFLDTSMSKIKLNQILAFDFNITFKPVLDTKPRKMTDAEVENQQDQLLKGTYGSIDIGTEKNKYLALWNPIVEDRRQAAGQSLQDLQENLALAQQETRSKFTKISSNITTALAKTQNAEVADVVKQFIDQNVRFRTYINDTIGNIQDTADQFKQKIKKN